MDPNLLVSDQAANGSHLLDDLAAVGFDVEVAFWARPTEVGSWYFYLASPSVDKTGALSAYRIVNAVVRKRPELGFGPLEIKLLGAKDSIAQAALASMKPKPYKGITSIGSRTFGGISFDGLYIYPRREPVVSA